MRSHSTLLTPRLIRAALRSVCRYRVVAIGIDNRNRIISIRTNSPRLPSRGYHAEERVMFTSPRSLSRIILARVNAKGRFMPIDPCEKCQMLALKRNVKIERWNV